jgi:hypothetical protein
MAVAQLKDIIKMGTGQLRENAGLAQRVLISGQPARIDSQPRRINTQISASG